MTSGLAFMSAFTWGKAQGYVTGPQDGGLLYWSGPASRNYNLLDFDRKRNFEQTVTYELPVGRGTTYFSTGVGATSWAAGRLRQSSRQCPACRSRFQHQRNPRNDTDSR